MVTTNNEVGSTVVLADNGVPDCFSGTTHTHSEWEETKDSHSIGVAGENCLVNSYTGEMVDISGLSETDDGVDEDICVARTSSADSEFAMGSVHWVAGLEGYNS